MERTKTIEVAPPVIVSAGTYDSMELRPPKVSEVRKAQTHLRGTADSTTQMMTHLTAAVSGWPVAAVENLDIDILLEAFDFLSGFMIGGQKTGEASSPS